MEDRDAELRERFETIQVGMSPVQVRSIMGVDPQLERGQSWGFQLSHASDTATEIDWILLVAFEDGKVKGKQTVYTCLYRTVRGESVQPVASPGRE